MAQALSHDERALPSTATSDGKTISQDAPELSDFHLPTSANMIRYNMYYTTSRTNIRLHQDSPDRPCIYYAETTLMTVSPRFTLRLGDSKTSPMIGLGRMHLTSEHMQIAVGTEGDPEHKLQWENLRRGHFRLLRADYEFSASDASSAGAPRRTFAWKRKQNLVYKTIYRCEDEEGRVVASMLSGGMANWKKGGEIEVAQGLDKNIERLLIVSAVSIFMQEYVVGWSVFRGYKTGKEKAKLGDGITDTGAEAAASAPSS